MVRLKSRVILLMAILVILLSLSMRVMARDMMIASTDRIARGDWTYDAMGKLAADEQIPGYAARVFQGDRLFNRIEMAKVIALVIKSTSGKTLSYTDTILIDKLVSEFRPELKSIDPSALDNWLPDATTVAAKKGFVTGQVTALASTHSNTDSDSNVSVSGFLNLSDRAFGMVSAEERRSQFYHINKSDSNPDKVFVKGIDGNFEWSLGREQMNWGPSYVGSLVLSDNIKGIYGARMAKEIDLGSFIGRFKVQQFVGTFKDHGDSLYLVGRRWERPLSHNFHLGVSETAKMNTAPNPLMLTMPLYLYQRIFVNNVDRKFNALYGIDLTHQSDSGVQVYGEWMVDDISAPKFLLPNSSHVARKTGLTLGFYTPKFIKGDKLSTFRAEYTYVDPKSYSATRTTEPELSFSYSGDIIGSPLGPNTKALYMRSEQYLSGKFSIIAEYLNQKQRNATPDVGGKNFVSALFSYDLTPNKSIGFQIAPYTITFPGQPDQKSTLYEVKASYTF